MQKDTQYIQLTIIDGVTMPDGYVLGVGRVGVTLGQGVTPLRGCLDKILVSELVC